MPDERFFVSESDPPAKREMLKAALRLFVRDGLCETSIRDIAAAAGFTNPALFKHFDGKDGLALCLFERCYTKLASEVAAASSPEQGFRHNLRAVLQRFAYALDRDLEAFLYVNEELRRFWPKVGPDVRRHSLVGLAKRLFESGMREGLVTREHSVELLVTAFVGIVAQLARALYFGELTGDAQTFVPALESLTLKLVAP
jgi:AcrR family transcriptional regulator